MANETSEKLSAPLNFSNSDRIVYIPPNRLKPHPLQPRKVFDERELEELKASIKLNGVTTPLLVTEEPDRTIHIISGERRWRAAMELDLDYVPCLLIQKELGAAFLIGTNIQEKLKVYERAIATLKWSCELYSKAMNQSMTPAEWAQYLRYINNPKGARVPPPPDWVLEHFAFLQRDLPHSLRPMGFTLKEMAEFVTALEGTHPLVREALDKGHTYWEAGMRISAWIKKMRKACPEHPELTDENLRDMIQLVGMYESRTLRQTLESERKRLAGIRATQGTTKPVYNFFKRVYRQSGRLGDEKARKKAQALVLEVEEKLRELEAIYAEQNVPLTGVRGRI